MDLDTASNIERFLACMSKPSIEPTKYTSNLSKVSSPSSFASTVAGAKVTGNEGRTSNVEISKGKPEVDQQSIHVLEHTAESAPPDKPEDLRKVTANVHPPQWLTKLMDRMEIYRGGLDTMDPRTTQNYSPVPPEVAEASLIARDSIKEVLENYVPRLRPSSQGEPFRQDRKVQQSVDPPSAVHSASAGSARPDSWIPPHLRFPRSSMQEAQLGEPSGTNGEPIQQESHDQTPHQEQKILALQLKDITSSRDESWILPHLRPPKPPAPPTATPVLSAEKGTSKQEFLHSSSTSVLSVPVHNDADSSHTADATMPLNGHTPSASPWIAPHLRPPRSPMPPPPAPKRMAEIHSSKQDPPAGRTEIPENSALRLEMTDDVKNAPNKSPGLGSSNDNTQSSDAWVPPHLRPSPAQTLNNPKICVPPNSDRFSLSKPAPPVAANIQESKAPILDTPRSPVVPPPRGPSSLTPSSLSLKGALPATAQKTGITSAARVNESKDQTRDGVLYFKSWGAPEHRDRAVARTRKVILTSSPPFDNPSPHLIASLVWGGPLEQIHTTSASATVTFLSADDCAKYYAATANGIPFGHHSISSSPTKPHIATVHLSPEVDVIGGRLQSFIDKAATRCVRAVGKLYDERETNWATLAKGRMTRERKVEKIIKGEKNARGADTVTWRFCDIRDAEAFSTELRRNELWEHCNIHYAPDPCAAAKGVHVD